MVDSLAGADRARAGALTNPDPMAIAPITEDPPGRRRPVFLPWIAAGLVLAGLLVVYPPFRIVPKGGDGAAAEASPTVIAFDPVSFATNFWSEQLQPATRDTPPAGPLLAALRHNPAAAAQVHARRVGLGSAAYYFVHGLGRVTAIERNRLLLEIEGVTVALRTGPVFGNAVRDGTGLLDVNQVPGLAEFNAVSAALNRLVEERVQLAFRTTTIGATISFTGCAEAPESVPSDGPLLTFIPVQAEVQP